MYLDIVIIDLLTVEGILTTFKIKPQNSRNVVIDRLSDIHPVSFNKDDLDMAGTRVYNSSTCSIDKQKSLLRSFLYDDKEHRFSFQFEHIGIPIGSSMYAHGGMYNFVLPPGWRLEKLWISDPYDDRTTNVEDKKQFRYNTIWDSTCNTQLIEVELRSGRGSFSFIVKGEASIYIDSKSNGVCQVKCVNSPLI